jgi:hypothetical protein
MPEEKKPHGGARKGAGRPPKDAAGKTMVVAASIPEGLVTQLDALAEQRGWNRSQAVTEAVRRLLRARSKA